MTRRKIKYVVLCITLWASGVLYLVHTNNGNDNKVSNTSISRIFTQYNTININTTIFDTPSENCEATNVESI